MDMGDAALLETDGMFNQLKNNVLSSDEPEPLPQ